MQYEVKKYVTMETYKTTFNQSFSIIIERKLKGYLPYRSNYLTDIRSFVLLAYTY